MPVSTTATVPGLDTIAACAATVCVQAAAISGAYTVTTIARSSSLTAVRALPIVETLPAVGAFTVIRTITAVLTNCLLVLCPSIHLRSGKRTCLSSPISHHSRALIANRNTLLGAIQNTLSATPSSGKRGQRQQGNQQYSGKN